MELENCRQENAIYLAALTIWKLCWIHPFSDGNGRTARAAGYYVFSVREGVLLPGRHILHEQILDDDAELYAYLDALRAADRSLKASGNADLTLMMALVERLLVRQLS